MTCKWEKNDVYGVIGWNPSCTLELIAASGKKRDVPLAPRMYARRAQFKNQRGLAGQHLGVLTGKQFRRGMGQATRSVPEKPKLCWRGLAPESTIVGSKARKIVATMRRSYSVPSNRFCRSHQNPPVDQKFHASFLFVKLHLGASERIHWPSSTGETTVQIVRGWDLGVSLKAASPDASRCNSSYRL